jgi:probable F420-dependent oxidoreductase
MTVRTPWPKLGRIGIWSLELRFSPPEEQIAAAAELDELGIPALWIPGGLGGDVTGDVDRLLGATGNATIATGIINVWRHEPEDIAAWWKALPAERQSRVLLGLGVSHGPIIGEAYSKPLAKMTEWLERITAAGVPPHALCVAALRPRMLALAAERTAGSHPYLCDVSHTRECRAILGPGKLLAPELGAILETDRARIRAVAQSALTMYTALPNYRDRWLDLGYSEDEIATCADRFIDGLFASGTPEQIRARAEQHLAAGADHVCIQVLTPPGTPFDALRARWRELAPAILS